MRVGPTALDNVWAAADDTAPVAGNAMALIFIVLAGSLAAGLALGGSVRGWERVSLRWWGLAPLGVALQAVPVPTGWHDRDTIGASLLVASYIILLAFVVANRRARGASLIGAGLVLNLAVVAPNVGMPVSPDAVRVAAGDSAQAVHLPQDETKHHVMTHEDVLRSLGDVIPVPPPFRLVLSVGDVLLYAGIGWFVIAVTRGRFRETPHSPHRRSRGYRGKHSPWAHRFPDRPPRPEAPAGAGPSGTEP
jgi:hypothetical protein